MENIKRENAKAEKGENGEISMDFSEISKQLESIFEKKKGEEDEQKQNVPIL